MIYNNPVDYKILVTLDMFAVMADWPTIQAVKESTRDVSNVTRMINRFGDRFSILCGVDTLALESLFMGAHGWVAGLVDAFPRETVAIYRHVQAGRHAEALAIYRWFLPLLEDGPLTATGQVTASDLDHDAVLAYSAPAVGAYGSFAVNAISRWIVLQSERLQRQDWPQEDPVAMLLLG